MPTTPPAITAPGLSPDPTDRTTYNARSYAWMAWLKANAVPEIYADALNCYNNAVEAATSAQTAVDSATTAVTAAGATVFNGATSYAQYGVAISPVNRQTYRRNTAGTSATDPSADATNWTLISGNSQTDAATWTPSIGGTATYTSRVGRYTKIGKLVYIEGFIQINTIGTGATFQISGLPFVSNSTNGTGAVTVSLWSGTATAVASLFGQVDSNASTITLRSTTAATSSPGANAIFANGAYIYFAGQYTTA